MDDEIIQYIWELTLSCVFGILAFMGVKMRKDVDKKVDKDRFDEFKADFREHIIENREAHQRVISQLSEVNKNLSKIEGKLSK